MMTNLLNGAHVANKLFSTIARLRLLLVMFLTLSVSAEVWGASIEINYGSSTTGWTIKDKEWSTKYWGLCNKTAYCIISPNFDDLSVITSVKVTARTYGNTSNNSNKIGVYANATRIGTQQTATSTFTEYTFTPNDLSGNGAITIQSDGTATGAGLRVTKVTIEYNDSPKDPCTITYEASLGNPDKTSEETTSSVTLPNISSIDCGDWEFAGWATASIEETNETPNPLYVAGSTYTPSSDITLYAVYQRTEDGGGNSTPTSVTKVFSGANNADLKFTTGSSSNHLVNNTGYTAGDANVKFTTGTNNNNSYYDGSVVRFYAGSSMIITPLNGVTITRVEIVRSSSTSSNSGTISADNLTASNSNSTINTNVFTGSSTTAVTFENSAQCRFTALNVTYTTSGGGSSTTYYHSTPDCGSTEPSPSLRADPTSLAFGNVATDSNKEMTFTLTGSNLTANASLQLSGINPGMFSLSSNSVTQSAGSINQTITVTYTPTAAGEHTATLTISSTGAESKTVALSGTGTAPAAKYTVTFNAGSGTCDDESLTETSGGAGVTLPTASPSNACTEEGWTFAGWTTESVSETYATPDPLYVAGHSYTPTADIPLYAVYSKTEGSGGATATSITTYQDGTYYLIDSFTDVGDNTTYHSPKGTGTKIPSEDMTEYVSVNDNVLTLNLTNAPLTEDMKYTISKENDTYKIYNAETEAYVEPSASGTDFKNTGASGWSIDDENNRFMFYYDARAFLYQDSYNDGGTKTYGQQFGNYAKTEAGTTDNQQGKECYGSGYFFLVPATNSTTTYNSNPECCTQPKTPLTITADQIELVKSGVVTLTATGGNGTDITWTATGGVLTNQSNTGATLTISDVDATQNITVTATQAENNNDDEVVYCAQEASIDITVKAQWTITFKTNDNGVKNSNSIIVTDGDSYTMPDISDEYVCTGSTSFAGWRSTETDGEPEQVAGSAVKATANTTWYAVWITTNDYTTETRDKYELVTTSQQITQNDVVIITYANGEVALGQMTEEDLYGSPVAVDFSADKSYLTFAEGTAVMPLKVLWWDDKDDDFDGWYFEDNANTGHYLTYSGEKGGTLYYETDWWMWDINITSQNNATISDTEEGYDQYNLQYNSSNSRFAFYTSSQKKVQLYRKNGTINIQIPSDPTYATNNTSCTRGAVISAEDGKWVTAANGQKVRTAINVTARGFKSAATLSATSNNPNFVVSLPNPSISASTVVNTTLNVEYTPTTAETTETAQITLTAGETTQTITVNGRSLPDEFVIVAQYNDKWLAVPANMQSGADQYNGIEVTPNNALTQIPAAPSTTIYSLRGVADSRYEEAGTCVRLVGNGNKCLWGNAATTNTTIQNWTTLGATNGSNYEWLLTTSDGELYTIANPAHPDYNQGRILSNLGSKYGLYKGTTKFYILPVGCSSLPGNIQVTARRVDATFSWEGNASSMKIDVYTNEAMTEGNISNTATASPYYMTGLSESTQYWFKMTPNGTDVTCAYTGSFNTTGPTIDVVEWQENAAVIFVDKDEDLNPLVIIDGEVEHGVGTGSQATELFFSKYFEAHAENKLLAIYNGTANTIDLTGYVIKQENAELNLALYGKTKGQIAPNEEIILVYFDATYSAESCAEKQDNYETWNVLDDKSVLAFSGRGSIGLYKNNVLIDVIGSTFPSGELTKIGKSGKPDDCETENDVRLYVDDFSVNDQSSFFCYNGDNIKTDEEENDYAISTNRCLLIRKNTVTSGANAVASNKAAAGATCGDLSSTFTTLCSEWSGFRIGGGKSSDEEIREATCDGLGYVGGFDYNQYYKEYQTVQPGQLLHDYDHNTDTKEYIIPIDNLANYSCLNIRFQLKQGDQVLTEEPVQVPIIVSGQKATNDAIFNAIVKTDGDQPLYDQSIERCKTCNVVVLSNATLTKAADGTDNDVAQVQNIKMYPGATLVVPEGTNYTVNTLSLRRQEDAVSMANIQGALNIGQANGVYLDVRIDPTNWHYMTLPYDCRVGDVTFADGTPAAVNTDYLLGWYDGAYRAEHKTGGWTYITDNDYILKKGLGYIVALPGDGIVKREIRFPMANSVIVEDKSDKTIDGLYAYGGDKTDEELRPNHKGWNMIGNPYLYTYTADIVKEPLQMGTLSKYGDPWDGSWERTGDARYIVEPIDNGWSGYRQTTIDKLKPFTSYFIQVGGVKNGEEYTTVTPETEQMIEFKANSIARNASAPRKVAEAGVTDNHPVWYGVEMIAPNNEKDNTTLLISDEFTDGYDMMDDLVKMRGDYYQYYNFPVLASRNNEGEMAFNALPDSTAAKIGVPLNYYAATAGTYTIATDGRFDLEEVKSAILYDATTAQECDLLLEDYTFTTAKGNNSDRFTLFVTVERKKAPSIPTGKDNLLTDGQLSLITIDRTLVLSGLTDKADIYVYDMTGKLIIGAHNSGDNGIWRTSVPTSGVYFVRVNGKTEAQTIKAVVK